MSNEPISPETMVWLEDMAANAYLDLLVLPESSQPYWFRGHVKVEKNE